MFYALLMKYVKVNVPWNRFKNTEPEFWQLLDQYQKQIESSAKNKLNLLVIPRQ